MSNSSWILSSRFSVSSDTQKTIQWDGLFNSKEKRSDHSERSGAGNRTFYCSLDGRFGQLGSVAPPGPHSLPRHSSPDFPFMELKNDHPVDDRFLLVRETGLEPA